METTRIREVQHNLATFIRRVEHGEVIEIRRRNKVVARLVPAGDSTGSPAVPNWEEIRKWRKKLWGRTLAARKPVSDLVYESREDR